MSNQGILKILLPIVLTESVLLEVLQSRSSRMFIQVFVFFQSLTISETIDEPLYSAQSKMRTIKPDFILIRNFPLDSHGDTFKV